MSAMLTGPGKPPEYRNGPPRPRARPGSQPWVDFRYERAVGVELGRTSALLDLMAVRSDGELTQQTVDTVMGNIAWIFEAEMQGPERSTSDTAAGSAWAGQDEPGPLTARRFAGVTLPSAWLPRAHDVLAGKAVIVLVTAIEGPRG